jgi:DNA-binding Lrp family transcriptional regulator
MSIRRDDNVLPKCFDRYGIDEIDLYILNKLNDRTYGWDKRKELTAEQQKFAKENKNKPWRREGASITTLNEDIEEELGIKISRGEVENRIETLVTKGVIKSLHSIIVDPTTLYDHVFFAFWKIPLAQSMKPYGWWDISSLWELDKREQDSRGRPFDLMRILAVPEGTGLYDFISYVTSNSLFRYFSLLERLQTKGFLASSMTQRVWDPTGIFFDPVKIPDYEEYKDLFREHYQKKSREKIGT